MFDKLRYFLWYRRLPHRIAWRLAHDPHGYGVQRIRFAKPRQSFTRWVVENAFYMSLLISAPLYVQRALKAAEEDKKKGKANEKSEDTDGEKEVDGLGKGVLTGPSARQTAESDRATFFLPLGWPRQLPRNRLKDGDLEVTEIQKFARDEKRLEMVRHELATIIENSVQNEPWHQRRFGQPMKCYLHRFDLISPPYPLPEYARGGLEFSSDGIRWTRRPVSPRNYLRLWQAIWPKSLVLSLKAASDAHLSEVVEAVKEEMEETRDAQNADQLPSATSSRPQEGKGAPQSSEQEVQAANSSNAGQISNTTSTAQSDSAKDIGSTKASSQLASAGNEHQNQIRSMSSSNEPEVERESRATIVFLKTLQKTWPPAIGDFGRCLVIFSGPVLITAPRGFANYDVNAVYDVQHNKWGRINVNYRGSTQWTFAHKKD